MRLLYLNNDFIHTNSFNEKYIIILMELLEATDSEDEIPEGWEERVTPDGQIYYAK